ncbi:hypothetical protein F4819DRAFT_505615 [Hypoxylon fuscum]|nr:hypothetical protein F4819DRAFT_505615 [Hypoxylon fuscum]
MVRPKDRGWERISSGESAGPPRPSDTSFQGILQQHVRQMEAAFQRVVSAIIKHSKLEITRIRISVMTEEYVCPLSFSPIISPASAASFHVSLDARASQTGPVKAVLSPMTLELCGPGGRFGHITLPELKTSPGGAPVAVENQLVRITDRAALQAFVQPAIRDARVVLSLQNGRATVACPGLGVGPRPLAYARDVPLPGMRGPAVRVQAASTIAHLDTPAPTAADFGSSGTLAAASSSSQTPVRVTLRVDNPSPVELSFGLCEFEVRSEAGGGAVFAALKGRLDIQTECFDAVFTGTADTQVPMGKEGKARLVGRRCVGAGWCDETIKSIDVPIKDVWKLLQALDMEYEEPKQEGSGVVRWRGRFWTRDAWI